MDKLLRILFEHPYLILILLAWIGGAVANVAKAAKKAKERAEKERRMPQAGEAKTAAGPAATKADPGQRSAEDVAAEMRRILGMEGPLPRPKRAPRAPVEAVEEVSPPPPPRRIRREVVEPERPPVPVAPVTQSRAIEIHVDPRVGDSIKGRHLDASRRGFHKAGEMGSLGGRVHEAAHGRVQKRRFPLDDLKTAFVLSEILGPPVALRDQQTMRGR